MHDNAQKFELKTQTKISCNDGELLHGEICLLDDALLEIFKLKASPVEGQPQPQEDKKRRKTKGKKKKN